MKDFVIESISLSNYRKFENNTFRLNPGMNVFIGKNASGKTTVLEAASVMLGHTWRHLRNMFRAVSSKIFQMRMSTEKIISFLSNWPLRRGAAVPVFD